MATPTTKILNFFSSDELDRLDAVYAEIKRNHPMGWTRTLNVLERVIAMAKRHSTGR